MRCFSCSKPSFNVICKTCKSELFVPAVRTRKTGTLDVISFYRYSSLEPLLHTKHRPEGYRVYKELGKMLFRPFMREYVEHDEGDVYIVGIDENIQSGYSHVAQLTHSMKMKSVHVQPASLMARNRVNYSGRPLQFRLDNPRDFVYRGEKGVDVILVDDIITTGITLQEAQKVLMEHDVNVLFALTLADVEEPL